MDSFCNTSSASWFYSFLTERTQSVKYCNTFSHRRAATSGTSEGSMLALSLFIIHINSLFSSLRPDFAVAHADNVTLVSSGSTLEESSKRAEEALAKLLSGSKGYGLIINPSKCCTMTVPPFLRKTAAPSNNLHLSDGNVYIKAICKMRLLGVVFKPDLKWVVHASNAQKSE